jgi:hypothetical protein
MLSLKMHVKVLPFADMTSWHVQGDLRLYMKGSLRDLI